MLKADGEFFSGSIAPPADAPRAHEIPVTEIESACLNRCAAALLTNTEILEQAINDVHLEGSQDRDAAPLTMAAGSR